jgi:hypothetical protein
MRPRHAAIRRGIDARSTFRRRAGGALALALALLLGLAGPATRAGYEDPGGLPSGTATLKVATPAAIADSAFIHALDVATGTVDSTRHYLDLVAAGEADLLLVELVGQSGFWFRAPEDVFLFDRDLIDSLGPDVALADIADMEGAELAAFARACAGCAYVLLQIQTDADPETTAVKFAVTSLGDSTATLDWVWQPNGTRDFIATAAARRSIGAVKALYR